MPRSTILTLILTLPLVLALGTSSAQARSGVYAGLNFSQIDVSFQMPALFAYSGATGKSEGRLGWNVGMFADLPLSEQIELRLGFEAQERRLHIAETREYNVEHPADGPLENVYGTSSQTLKVFGLGLPLRLLLRPAPEHPVFFSLGGSLYYLSRIYRSGRFEALTFEFSENFETSVDQPGWDLQFLLGTGFDFSLGDLDLFVAGEIAASLGDIYGEPGPLTHLTDIQGSIDDLELLAFTLQVGLRFPN